MKKALVVVAALLIGACGSDGGNNDGAGKANGSTASEPATAAGLEAAAREITEYLLANDVQRSFDRLNAACRKKHGLAGWGAQLAFAAGAIESFAGVKGSELEVRSVTTRSVTATSGEAAVDIRVKKTGASLGGEDDPEFSAYAYEDGKWRQVDCEAFGGDDSEDVSAETAQAWIGKWCLVNPGETKESVRSVMGEPTSEFDDQDEWNAFNLSFTAFYDSHAAAYQLQTDTTDWSAADKAALKCAEVRKNT